MPTKTGSIEELLKPLAVEMAEEADVLLDLRELLLERGHPGSCVRCFFRLFVTAGSKGRPLLAPLRHWIEQELEIEVSERGRLLEVLPVEVRSGDTLESFCRRAISQVRHDRAYTARRIRLGFRYKEAA